MSFQTSRDAADVIRNNTAPNSNTKELVADLFDDVIDSAEAAVNAVQGNLDGLDPDMEIDGGFDASTFDPNTDLPAADKGQYLTCTVAGTFTINGTATDFEVGDQLKCTADGTAANTQANWYRKAGASGTVTELSQVQVEDATNTVFGSVSGQRLKQAYDAFNPDLAQGNSTTAGNVPDVVVFNPSVSGDYYALLCVNGMSAGTVRLKIGTSSGAGDLYEVPANAATPVDPYERSPALTLTAGQNYFFNVISGGATFTDFEVFVGTKEQIDVQELLCKNSTSSLETDLAALQAEFDNLDPDKEIDGGFDASTFNPTTDLPAADKGYYLTCTVAGTFTLNTVSTSFEVGDQLKCSTDNTAANTQANWYKKSAATQSDANSAIFNFVNNADDVGATVSDEVSAVTFQPVARVSDTSTTAGSYRNWANAGIDGQDMVARLRVVLDPAATNKAILRYQGIGASGYFHIDMNNGDSRSSGTALPELLDSHVTEHVGEYLIRFAGGGGPGSFQFYPAHGAQGTTGFDNSRTGSVDIEYLDFNAKPVEGVKTLSVAKVSRADQTGISQGTIALDTVDINVGGIADTSNNGVTVLESGNYSVKAHASIATTAGGNLASLILNVNGVEVTRVQGNINTNANASVPLTIAEDFPLSANDTLTLQTAYAGSGAVRNVSLGVRQLPNTTVVGNSQVAVDITGITDGDTLVWNAANQQFEPGTPAAGGGGFAPLVEVVNDGVATAPFDDLEFRISSTSAQIEVRYVGVGTIALDVEGFQDSSTPVSNTITGLGNTFVPLNNSSITITAAGQEENAVFNDGTTYYELRASIGAFFNNTLIVVKRLN